MSVLEFLDYEEGEYYCYVMREKYYILHTNLIIDVYKRQLIEGTRYWRRSLDGQAAVEDENLITSVIFGSGKCVNIVQAE